MSGSTRDPDAAPRAARVGAVGLALWVLALLAMLPGCDRRPPGPTRVSMAKNPPAVRDLSYLRFERVGREVTSPPWIAHVNAVDLDGDQLLDIVACDTRDSTILWIRQSARGKFEETTIAEGLLVPVRVEPADIDQDGDLDLLVSSMGEVFPNNDRIGTVFILENDGNQHFTKHAVLELTTRVTDVRAGDFNGDGHLDLALAQFGYDQGEVSWLERVGPWEFRRHVLLDLSGAINIGVADFNGDGRLDIVSNISQQWEEVHYFENNGRGGFSRFRIWGSANDSFIEFPGMKKCNQTDFSLWKNGNQVQRGNIQTMIFDLQSIIDFCAIHFGLGKGDIIFTGTPEGVGHVTNRDQFCLKWGEDTLGEFSVSMTK